MANEKKYVDPLTLIRELSNSSNPGYVDAFLKNYESFIRSLQNQVFAPNGYKLVAIKDDSYQEEEKTNISNKSNEITLNFPSHVTRLSGKDYGEEIFNQQIKNKISYSQITTLKIPNHIQDISISFIQGLTDDIFNNIQKDEFTKHFKIEGNKQVKDKVMKSIYY